jgi:hypothetical protein
MIRMTINFKKSPLTTFIALATYSAKFCLGESACLHGENYRSGKSDRLILHHGLPPKITIKSLSVDFAKTEEEGDPS